MDKETNKPKTIVGLINAMPQKERDKLKIRLEKALDGIDRSQIKRIPIRFDFNPNLNNQQKA